MNIYEEGRSKRGGVGEEEGGPQKQRREVSQERRRSKLSGGRVSHKLNGNNYSPVIGLGCEGGERGQVKT